MRWLAYVAVFVLSGLGMFNHAQVEIQARNLSMGSMLIGQVQAPDEPQTGIMTIYKTTPDVLLPQVREAGSTIAFPHRNDCPIGTCQDV